MNIHIPVGCVSILVYSILIRGVGCKACFASRTESVGIGTGTIICTAVRGFVTADTCVRDGPPGFRIINPFVFLATLLWYPVVVRFVTGTNSVETVQVLVQHGAELNMEANNGYTPLQ